MDMVSAKRLLWLALAAGLAAPGTAAARGGSYAPGSTTRAPQRVSPRSASLRATAPTRAVSPCGRHVVELASGAVHLDGRRVQGAGGAVELVARPAWRRDGGAVAWIERSGGMARLIVVPAVGAGAAVEPLSWPLPGLTGGERIFWAGPSRINVGPALLQPRAVASWSS